MERQTKGMKKELAIRKLLDGNARFAANKSIHPHMDIETRFRTIETQNPFALVISCFDSRVSPEIIFDQGIGDLFVLRSPGNTLNEDIIGATEYAVKAFNIPLIIVLGHENCAAVEAALNNIKTFTGIDKTTESIRNNIEYIDPYSLNALDNATKKNVKTVCNQLITSSTILFNAVKHKKLEITGMYYHLKNGNAEIISDSSWADSCKNLSCILL